MPQSIARVIGLKPAVLAVMLLACGGGATTAFSATSHSSSVVPTTAPIDPEIVSFVKSMNAHRVSLGLSALVWDNRLAAVAQAHSRAMFDRHYFSHKWPGGGSTWDRLAARGVTYSQAGENIAWGQSTGSAVLRAWLLAPGTGRTSSSAPTHTTASARLEPTGRTSSSGRQEPERGVRNGPHRREEI